MTPYCFLPAGFTIFLKDFVSVNSRMQQVQSQTRYVKQKDI